MVMLSFGVMCTAGIHSGIWANIIDIGPRHAGYLLGLSNTFAAMPGVVGNVVTGFILQRTGSWSAVFGVTISVYVMGLIVYARWARATVLFR